MKSSELRHRFMLEPASSFRYLNQSGCYTLEGVNDSNMFDQLRLALQVSFQLSVECIVSSCNE